MIICGRETLYPEEIELMLQSHLAVLEAAMSGPSR